jgi:hypothetical protein
VSVVRYTARRPFLLRSNDTGGDLGALRPPPKKAGEGDGPKDPAEAQVESGDATVGGGAG